jgi:hypothetical protein
MYLNFRNWMQMADFQKISLQYVKGVLILPINSVQIFSVTISYFSKKSGISYKKFSEVFSKCVWYNAQGY